MNFLKNLPTKHLMAVAFIATLISFSALFYAVYNSNKQIRENTDSVIHTEEILLYSESLLESVVNMETGYRGFLLTNTDEFLEPYNKGKKTAKKYLNALLQLTANNSIQTENFTLVKQEVELWDSNVIKKGIAIRRNKSNTDVIDFVRKATGKKHVDTIRELLAEASSREKKLLAQREDEQESALSELILTTLGLALLGSFISGIILLLINHIINKNVHEISIAIEMLAEGRLKPLIYPLIY